MSNDLVKKTKSFWDTKEGTTGMVFGAGVLGLLGWGAYTLMPYIANLLENTFYAVLFGLLAVGLIYVTVIDATLRNRLWLMYKLMMRALTYSMIKYDPIGILRETQKNAKERLRKVDEARTDVNAQVSVISQTIDGIRRDEKKYIAEIEWKKANGKDPADINNSAARLGKLKESDERLTKSLDLTTGFYKQLTRAFNALQTIDSNIDFEIDIREREYKAVNASNNAWRTVKAAFNGSDDFDGIQHDAFAFLAEDYASKLGEIDTFMSDASKFIESADIQNAIYAEGGMQMIQDLNARNLDIVSPANVIQNKPVSLPVSNNGSQFGATIGSGSIDYSSYKK
jgi:hypothetical protein